MEIAPLRWRVFTNGYHLVDGLDKMRPGRQALVPNNDWPWREFKPVKDEPGLFRTFADLKPEASSIESFAARYGTLGVTFDIEDWMKEPVEMGEDDVDTIPFRIGQELHRRETTKEFKYGDYLDDWLAALARMKEAVTVFDRLQTREATDAEVNRLCKYCNYFLGKERVVVGLARDQDGHRLLPQLIPSSLLGVMWLQLAIAVGEQKVLRKCPTCFRWFEVGSGRGKAKQEFCKVACRVQAYRERMEKAIELAGAGKTPRQISILLETDLETVRTWIKKSKTGKE